MRQRMPKRAIEDPRRAMRRNSRTVASAASRRQAPICGEYPIGRDHLIAPTVLSNARIITCLVLELDGNFVKFSVRFPKLNMIYDIENLAPTLARGSAPASSNILITSGSSTWNPAVDRTVLPSLSLEFGFAPALMSTRTISASIAPLRTTFINIVFPLPSLAFIATPADRPDCCINRGMLL